MLRIIGHILLGILLFLFLLLILPVRARVRFDQALQMWVGYGPVNVKLLPKGKKAGEQRPKKKKEKEKKSASKEPKPKKKLSLEEILDYIHLGLDAVGKMKRRLLIPHLQAAIAVGGKDAGAVALTYGRLAAGISALYPVLDRNLRIRKTDISVDADFEKTKIESMIDITVSACPLRLLFAGLLVGIAFLRVYLKHQKKKKGGKINEQHQ